MGFNSGLKGLRSISPAPYEYDVMRHVDGPYYSAARDLFTVLVISKKFHKTKSNG
jgi:hypothetical protein